MTVAHTRTRGQVRGVGVLRSVRGQVMMEFVLVLGIAVVICMVYLIAAENLLKDTSEEQRVMEIDSIGYGIQDEIILATSVSDGYIRTISIPKSAGRFEYSISVENDTPISAVGIRLASGKYVQSYELPRFNCSLPSPTTCTITSVFGAPNNTSNVTIHKINGAVMLS